MRIVGACSNNAKQWNGGTVYFGKLCSHFDYTDQGSAPSREGVWAAPSDFVGLRGVYYVL
jgi:hypothetical protein